MSETNEATKLAEVLGADFELVTIADTIGSGSIIPVKVRALRLKQFSEVLKCIDELSDAGVNVMEGDKGFDTAKLILRGGDAAMKLLAIATEQPLPVVHALGLDEAATLAGAVWRVNRDFFQKKADTMLGAFGISPEMAASLKKLLASLTPSLSSSSAEPSASSSPAS